MRSGKGQKSILVLVYPGPQDYKESCGVKGHGTTMWQEGRC